MKRILTVVGAAATILLLLIAGMGGYLIGTNSGTSILIRQASVFAPGELVVEGIAGTLLEGISAERVTYTVNDITIEGVNVDLRIRLNDLFERTATIERLTTSRVVITGGTLNQQIDGIELAGKITRRGAWVEKLSGSVDEFMVAITGDITFEPLLPITAAIEWSDTSGAFAGSGNVSGNLDQLTFEQTLVISMDDIQQTIEVDGVVLSVLSNPAIDAQARWDHLLPLVEGFDEFESDAGRGRITGTPDDYKILITTDLQLPTGVSGKARISAHGNTESLSIDEAKLTGFGGEITVSGNIELGADPTFAIVVNGDSLNPGHWQPDFAGELGFSATIDGGLSKELKIDVIRADGVFSEVPFEGTGQATLADGSIKNSKLTIRSGANSLQFSAVTTPNLAGNFKLDAPQLTGLWPGLAGQLKGDGSLSGTIEQPVITAQLTGNDLEFQEQKITKLFVNGRIDADGHLDWAASALGLQSSTNLIGDLKFTIAGNLEEHRLQVTLTGGPADLWISSAGNWEDVTLAHSVTALTVDLGETGIWTLRDPADIEISGDRALISAICLDNAPAWFCTDEIRWSKDLLVAGGNLVNFPLASINAWLGPDMHLTGTANSELTVQWRPDDIDAKLTWKQQDTRLIHGDELETALGEVNVSVTATNDEAVLRAEINGDYGLRISADASLQEPLADNGVLEGQLRAEIPDLAEMRLLINRFVQTTDVSGSFAARIDLAGTRSNPVLSGRASLQNGAARIDEAGITLSDARVEITVQDDNALKVSGSVRSGEGRLTVDGIVTRSESLGIFADISLSGNDFEILKTADQHIQISPDLKARLDDNQIIVSGRVLIPTAKFVVEELAESAVDTSADVIVHGREDETPSSLLPGLIGSLNVELGDQVTFTGFGIETRLTGGMQVDQQPASPATGEGSLQLVDGRFSIYGKQMTIERGSLNFFGPLNDPVINVRASRQLRYEGQEIKVGVLLRGQISKQLDFVVFSEPSMSETDTVSYLVLDRPASTAEGSDSQVVSAAALNLGMQSFTQQIGEGLNLDEVGVEGTGGADTAVAAGKRLSDDLYVRYTFGLFNKIGTFVVRYYLGKGISIVAGSGDQQSLELVYSIER